MKIRLWRGFHSEALAQEIRATWEKDELLILCPPYLENFDFAPYLPAGEISFIGDWAELSLPALTALPRAEVYSERPVLGVFTSGTVSGEPRLVLYTKSCINASLDAIFDLFEAARVRTIFCYAQPFHTFGLLLGYVLSFKIGAKLITPDGKYSSKAHEKRLAVRDPDLLTLGTPAHFYDLIQFQNKQAQNHESAIAPSYSCIMGGASVSVKLWQDVRRDLKIEMPSIGYGCSEASPGITHLPPGHPPKEDAEIGFALGNLISDFTRDAVSIQGASLCLAIIDKEGVDFSKQRKIRDTIRRRADGALIFEGRSDLVINRGGEKLSLELLESAALSELAIEVLAVAVPDERLGEDLGLLIKTSTKSLCSQTKSLSSQTKSLSSQTKSLSSQTKSLSSQTESQHRIILQRLQDYFLLKHRVRLEPSLCEFVQELPRNSSFKPDRKRARHLIEAKAILHQQRHKA